MSDDERTADWLPVWNGPRGGSGCDNPECSASDQYVRVLSVEELSRVYQRKRDLPRWPIPHQVTHMCDRCGEMYGGQRGPYGLHVDRERSVAEVPLDEWDWSPEDAWEVTVRTAVAQFIAGAPADASRELIVEGVAQHVPGVNRQLAHEVLADDTDGDDDDESLARFM